VSWSSRPSSTWPSGPPKWTTYGKIAKTAVERAPKKALLAIAGGVGTVAAVATARERRSGAPTPA
jgi:hypothetical protein